MAKGRIVQILENPEIDPRTAFRLSGWVWNWPGKSAQPRNWLMRHEIHVPPAAQEMIARRIMELQKQSEAIDADRCLSEEATA